MIKTNFSNLLHKVNLKARYDLLSVVMICLGDSTNKENKLIKMLNAILSEKLSLTEKENLLTTEYGIVTRTDEDGGVNLMCNLSDRIEQIGIKKGIEHGSLKTLFSLYKDHLISLQEAANRISMTEEEFLQRSQNLIQ